MLTARADETDRVAGLDAGADDYIVKPFSPKELLARVRAVLRRRAPHAAGEAITVGALTLDPATHRVTWSGAPIRLGPTEFRLLHHLLRKPERVHSRAQLLDKVWGDHVFIEERTVDVHVKRLRESLREAAGEAGAAAIETVRGAGYRLNVQALP
jgi:two-component system phosphate regulon response regulator PhoB